MNNTPTPSESDTPTVDVLGVEAKDFILTRPYTKVIGIEHARTLERSLRKALKELTAAREELTAVTEQRDKYRDIASELIAMIRINVMRDTFKTATTEQVNEYLKQWIERIAAVKGGSDEC